MSAFAQARCCRAGLPRLLEHVPERSVMLVGAALTIAGLSVLAVLVSTVGLFWPLLLGLGSPQESAIQAPHAVRTSPAAVLPAEDRPALFAAQFTLSHCGWLATYPLSGW